MTNLSKRFPSQACLTSDALGAFGRDVFSDGRIDSHSNESRSWRVDLIVWDPLDKI